MPAEMEKALRKEGLARGYKGKILNAFIFGIMRKRGWKPSREKR